ncbi:MAG TPA: hypothetical protein DD670_15480 [Planctomycetaceae bacterium]|nr:hypothetical protein [Planctomycetaceae bacterium]
MMCIVEYRRDRNTILDGIRKGDTDSHAIFEFSVVQTRQLLLLAFPPRRDDFNSQLLLGV